MIKLQGLQLTDYVLFKSVSLQLDAAPLTTIRGLNNDRKQSKDPSYNAVGKSLLPSSIVSIILGEPPFSGRKNKANELVFGKASAGLSLTDNSGIDHVLKQYADKKSVRYAISTAGKDEKYKDIAPARAKIAEILPLRPEHVFSQFYISSYRPSVLWYGRAADRHDYFESVFDLSVYDVIVKMFNKKKFQLELSAKQLEGLKGRKKELVASSNKRSLTELKTKMAELQRRSNKLIIKVERYNKEINKITTFLAIADQLQNEVSPSKIELLLREAENNLSSIETRYEELHQAVGEAKAEQKNDQLRDELTQRIESIAKVKNSEAKRYRKELPELQTKVEELDKLIELCQKHSDPIRKYLAINLNKISSKLLKTSAKALGKQIEVIEARIIGWQEATTNLKQLSSSAENKCPMCSQPISKMHFQETNTALKASIHKASKELKSLKKARFVLRVREIIPAKLLRKTAASELHLQLQQTQKIIDRYNNGLLNYRERQSLQARLDQLPDRANAKGVSIEQLKSLAKKRDKLAEKVNSYKNDLKLHENLHKLGLEAAGQGAARVRITTLQMSVAKLSPRLSELQDKFARLTTMLTSEQILREQLVEIESELDNLEEETKDRELITALAQAYSPRGLRLAQVQALAESYVSVMTDSAPLLYPESMVFSSNVDYGKFDIMAERNKFNADVRTLSGSESRQFLLLSMYSQLHLMPDTLRLNCAFLDEMESGMSKPEKYLYAEHFLPQLQTIVPHVFAITATSGSELYIPNSRQLLLTRSNGHTKISEVKGN